MLLYRLLFAEIKFSFLSFSISELSIFLFLYFVSVYFSSWRLLSLYWAHRIEVKDFFLSCIKPYIQLYLAIKNSVLHPLLSIYLIWLLFPESTVSLDVWVVYYIDHWRPHCSKHIYTLFLSYQASLAYNPKEFLGVITNWRRCRGDEIQVLLSWDTTQSWSLMIDKD